MNLISRIDIHNNTPAIFINDEPVVPVMCEGEGEFVSSFIPAGIHIYKPPVPVTIPRGQYAMGWDGAGTVNYEKDEKIFGDILDKDPDGYLMPYVGYVDKVPQPWLDKNPDEMTRLSNRELGDGPSSASEKFAILSDDLITRYIDHFENSRFGERIIGYHVVNGRSYEWLSWNWLNKQTTENKLIVDDYSTPMLEEFRRWLKEKYLNDVDALREAWQDTQVTFDKVDIPTPDHRFNDYGNVFPRGGDGVRVFDYYSCYADSWVKLAIRFCDTAKKAVNFSKLIGIFHGYMFLNCHNTYIQHVGHLAFSTLLKSPSLDIIFAPYCYENRGVTGCHFPQVCESSVMLHNKIFVDQIDTRTAIVVPKQPQWGQPDTVEESLNVMKRDVGVSITHGCSYYWFDMLNHVHRTDGPHWYDHPRLKSMLAKLTEISKDALSYDCRSNADIAVFVDEESYLMQRPHRGFNTLYITAQRQYELDKISAPFDSYVLEDLPDIREYKLYIFLNAFIPSEKILKSIKERIYMRGATALWFYAPMCCQSGFLEPEKCEEKIGIKLGLDNRIKDFIHVEITNSNHPYTNGLNGDLAYGSDIDPSFFTDATAYFPTNRDEFKFSPLFYSDDSDAEVLGIIDANGKPGFVTKKWGNGNVVYSAAPLMPAKLIRNIASIAGVHLYSEGEDLVYANKQFLFIKSGSSGRKKLVIPCVATITDALTKEVIIENTRSFYVNMTENETRIFQLYKNGERL